VHTNGLTLCREIAERLPQGYATPVGDGRTYGEALLAPSVIYVAFVRECHRRGLKLNYVAHVTGHGWRKLMRLDEPFVYEITTVRPEPALFKFLMKSGPIELREAYATFNMGVGFAAYVAPELAHNTIAAAQAAGYDAWLAGRVWKQGARKAVIMPSLGLTFEGETLKVR
jgi:phosphoribosylformylglycinamidine cyclo-ligase